MRKRLVIVAAALVVAIGLGLGLGFGLGGGSGSDLSATAQLESIRTGCQQWFQDTSARPGTSQWCDDMAQWMSGYMHRDGFGPRMMWGDPSRLQSICEQWFGNSPPPGAETGAGTGTGTGAGAADWCDSMVSWMRTHMGMWSGQGTWGAWMGRGPMMGLGATT